MSDQDEFAELEKEFARIGTSAYEAFRQLVNLNATQGATPTGAPINVSFDPTRTLQLLRTIPDGAGMQAFLAAFLKEFSPRWPKQRPDAPGA